MQVIWEVLYLTKEKYFWSPIKSLNITNPQKKSMHVIFTYIDHKHQLNVGKDTMQYMDPIEILGVKNIFCFSTAS